MSDTSNVSAKTISTEFKNLVTVVHGDSERTATNICSQNEPKEKGLVYVSDKKLFQKLLDSPVSIIVTTEALAGSASPNDKTILSTKNVYLAMAMINKKFFANKFLKQPFAGDRIHKSASVHPSAKIAATAVISPNVVIYENVVIGERVFIGANTVIEANSSIGDDTYLHPLVYIGHTVKIGARCEVKPNSTIGSDGFGYAHDAQGNHYRLPHNGATILEDDVHVGANVNIDRGTYDRSFIGAGTKIDNHCHFGHNITMGKNCIVTGGFISAGSVTVGDNCVIGGRSTINGQVEITSGVTLGGLSGAHNDVTKPGIYAGYPLTDFKHNLRVQASLPKLPELRRQVAKIMKHLGLNEDEAKQGE